ncbi:MAG: UDP-2,3-diacylglucosamine diphosphatase LpxI [Synergistales bacterium]|nr:UDP-2,3-diacylglucosamine diphosphatase LpxI [Synergistales bacterium]
MKSPADARGCSRGDRIALFAGGGKLPLEIFEKLAQKGIPTLVISFGSEIEGNVGGIHEIIHLENLDLPRILGAILDSGIKTVLLAGNVPKGVVFTGKGLDGGTMEMITRLESMDDHALLGAVVDRIESFGVRVVRYMDLIPELLVPDGYMPGREPSVSEKRDIAYGLPIIRSMLPFSFGQSIVVSRCSVVAVEAMEGTDSTVRRAGTLGTGGTLMKMMRVDQDERFDIPTVGPVTLELMKEAGLTCLALETGRTIILEREHFEKLLRDHDIAVVGV